MRSLNFIYINTNCEPMNVPQTIKLQKIEQLFRYSSYNQNCYYTYGYKHYYQYVYIL